MYVLSTGCQWRAIPKDLPPKSTVHDYFNLWTYDGTLKRMRHALYEQCREQEQREACPSAALIHSQSVKSAEKGGPASTRMATMRAKDQGQEAPSSRHQIRHHAPRRRSSGRYPDRGRGGCLWQHCSGCFRSRNITLEAQGQNAAGYRIQLVVPQRSVSAKARCTSVVCGGHHTHAPFARRDEECVRAGGLRRSDGHHNFADFRRAAVYGLSSPLAQGKPGGSSLPLRRFSQAWLGSFAHRRLQYSRSGSTMLRSGCPAESRRMFSQTRSKVRGR